MDAPRGIVAMGDVLFVSELNSHCVRKLKLGDGSQLASFGSMGAGDGSCSFRGEGMLAHTHTLAHDRNQRSATTLCVRSTLRLTPRPDCHAVSGVWRASETRFTWSTGATSGWWR